MDSSSPTTMTMPKIFMFMSAHHASGAVAAHAPLEVVALRCNAARGGTTRTTALHGQRGTVALHQLVEREVEQIPIIVGIDHHFAGAPHHRLDGVDVQALACHFRSLLVFTQKLQETCRLTF